MGLLEQQTNTQKVQSPKEFEQMIREKAVKPEEQQAYDRIVIAGLAIMTNEGMSKEVLDAIAGDDKPEDIGRAIYEKLMPLLYQRSRGTMPVAPAAAAGGALALHALQIASDGGLGVNYDSETIGRVLKAYSAADLEHRGITPEKLEQMKQAQQGQQEPAQQQPTGLLGA